MSATTLVRCDYCQAMVQAADPARHRLGCPVPREMAVADELIELCERQTNPNPENRR